MDTVKVSKSESAQSLGVLFGSNQCMKCTCSNWYLLTIPVYAIAGLLLVFLLFALRLTLTTGNSQSCWCRNDKSKGLQLHDVWILKQHMDITECCFSYRSKSWSGFPMCFYKQMTQLTKTAFYLLFPVYLLTIVAVLNIASHYSVTTSNWIDK